MKANNIGVTSVRVEDGQNFEGVVCAFHHRNSTICCISDSTRNSAQKGLLAKIRRLMAGNQNEQPIAGGRRRTHVRGIGKRSNEGDTQTGGVTVSYEVWRTIEETNTG